ncbi:MAG: 30S ribosome-binding factor RbfA [Actinomycetota bacterium]|nr:30S ribosome-binding factor RbfA [Actinomycetota bacterium]
MVHRHNRSETFSRIERVSNEVQRAVGVEIERIYDPEALGAIITVTEVKVDPDLRRARVYLDHITPEMGEWLEKNRVRLQGAIARSVRMRQTPHLEFIADPAIEMGGKIESILRKIVVDDHLGDDVDDPSSPSSDN